MTRQGPRPRTTTCPTKISIVAPEMGLSNILRPNGFVHQFRRFAGSRTSPPLRLDDAGTHCGVPLSAPLTSALPRPSDPPIPGSRRTSGPPGSGALACVLQTCRRRSNQRCSSTLAGRFRTEAERDDRCTDQVHRLTCVYVHAKGSRKSLSMARSTDVDIRLSSAISCTCINARVRGAGWFSA